MKDKKVAIVHDWLTNMGGAEQVVLNLHECFNDAPIYTTFYTPEKMDKRFEEMEVITSSLQKKKNKQYNHKKYLPFMPKAFEEFNLNDYDVIISSSSSCAKGVITKPRKCAYLLLSYTYALCMGDER